MKGSVNLFMGISEIFVEIYVRRKMLLYRAKNVLPVAEFHGRLLE